jgi:hypothetical protein
MYFARKDRWLLSGILGLLASLTKIQGVLLVAPLLVIGFTNKNYSYEKYKAFGASIITVFGLLAFLAFSYTQTGNFLTTFEASKYFYNRDPNILNGLKAFGISLVAFNELPLHSYLFSKIDTIFLLVYLLLLIPMQRVLKRPEYIFYSILLILIPLLSGKTTSSIRYLSLSFPHLIVLAQLTYNHKLISYAILFTFFALATLFAVLFAQWYWVA